MSFFNESTACQANANPLNKLINTPNEDVQQFNPNLTQNNPAQQRIHNFNQIDASLQRDFNSFQHPAAGLNNSVVPSGIHMNYDRLPSGQKSGWVQDFNHLSIQDLNPQTQSSFQDQIQNPVQYQTQHQTQNQNFASQQTHYQPRYQVSEQMPSYMSSNNIGRVQSNVGAQQAQQSQVQQQSTMLETEQHEFDDMFDEVENELKQEQNTQVAPEREDDKIQQQKYNPNDEEDKIKFAMLAQNVFNTMNNTPKNISSTTSNKFKQSGFMQLMSKISNREIEISNDKTKLIDQNGIDIRSNSSSTINSFNNLGDPLQNVKEGSLSQSPFDAAVQVGRSASLNVNSSSWQGEFA